MCGIKYFSSVRWYWAPQLLHLTTIAISKICASAHLLSSTDGCHNQTDPLPLIRFQNHAASGTLIRITGQGSVRRRRWLRDR